MMNSRGYDRIVYGPAAQEWALAPEREAAGVASSGAPVVLAVGGLSDGAAEALSSERRLVVSEGGPLAWQMCAQHEVAVLVVGPELPGTMASTFLAEAREKCPQLDARVVVLAAGDDLSAFQRFIDDDTVFFLSRRPLGASELLAIVRSATHQLGTLSMADARCRRRLTSRRCHICAPSSTLLKRWPRSLT